jgi:peptidoglycan/LPS O-acetylase OafA/YrhL
MLAAHAFQSFATHRPFAVPPPGSFVAHVFSLQEILGDGSINIVSWTLCLEFQLYVVFALLLAGTALVARGDRLETTLRPSHRLAERRHRHLVRPVLVPVPGRRPALLVDARTGDAPAARPLRGVHARRVSLSPGLVQARPRA